MAETQYVLTQTKQGKKEWIPLPTGGVAAHNQAWSTITDTPTTLAGYGITDAGDVMEWPGAGIALSDGSAWLGSIVNNSANWNTAYSWVNTNGANAVTAYGWGNHALAGYAPTANPTFTGSITATNLLVNSYLKLTNSNWGLSGGSAIGQTGLFVWHDSATKNMTPLGIGVAINRAGVAAYFTNAGGYAAVFDAGNIGFGDTAPSEKVTVSGNVKATAFKTANYTITEDSGDLVVEYGSTIIGRITAAGYIKAKDEMEPFASM